jgi:glutathione S-transferase
MSVLTLYFAPDTCARVPLIALEQAGGPYGLEIVKFALQEHRSSGYLALNPKGKVPTLIIDGQALSENVAILSWLADSFPEAKLLPGAGQGYSKYEVLSDLAFCASALHPIVTRIRIPQFFCDTADGIPRVYQMASAAMRPNFELIERRLTRAPWWYGAQWSILDAYINWVFFRVTGAGLDASPYPRFAAHDEATRRHPATQRALDINARIAAELSAQGLAIKFSGSGAVAAAPPGQR